MTTYRLDPLEYSRWLVGLHERAEADGHPFRWQVEQVRARARREGARLTLGQALAVMEMLPRLVRERRERLRKRYERDADLSRFYGFSTLALTETERIGLEMNVRRMKAQDTLEAVLAGRLDMKPDDLIDLAREATGDEEQAQDIALEVLKQKVWRKPSDISS